jgi:hypothetical protein
MPDTNPLDTAVLAICALNSGDSRTLFEDADMSRMRGYSFLKKTASAYRKKNS